MDGTNRNRLRSFQLRIDFAVIAESLENAGGSRASNSCIFEPLHQEKNPQSLINPLKKKFQPLSVSKASLIELGRIHPLPRVVVEFRKVSAIIQTIICPLLQASTFHVSGVERIAGECEFRNATGRVNIVQPNLQHIPRPFSLSDGRMINVRSAFHAATGDDLFHFDMLKFLTN
jgi:hypothetical protein